jgi:hypothetical protein
MAQSMEVSASARVNGSTSISVLTCRDGTTEFTFDYDGLYIAATERGLGKLADAVNTAVREREAADQACS